MRFSLEEFARELVTHAEPLSQNTGAGNMGFGWLYYGLVRNLRPEFVVAIGSRRGFMPFSAARAVQENGSGQVLFIDPSYDGLGHPGWSGGGLWNDPGAVADRIEYYDLTGWIDHLKMTSEEAAPLVRDRIGSSRQPGIVIIDGAHTKENSLQDFELYTPLFSEGFVLFHDSVCWDTGVPGTIRELQNRGLPMITLHREVGLTIVEISPKTTVAETWGYLCRESNRGALIAERLQGFVQANDQILECYCGLSPLPAHLKDASIFGFDSDPAVIGRLCTEYPRHQWRVIEESRLPYVSLPDHVDVLAGLGVSYGYAPWDPHFVLENARYLLGRYLPRACVFETAADYHDADILTDLKHALVKLGYACQFETIDTDMESFARRTLLFATRRSEWPPHWVYRDPDEAHAPVLNQIPNEDRGRWSFVKSHPYLSAHGKELFRVLRFENDAGQKRFQPVTKAGDTWRLGTPDGKLPLFRLAGVAATSTVFVVEGEKTAEAANELGLPTVTAAYGSGSPLKTDWSPLAGKDVVIFPDCDAAGRSFAAVVSSVLANLSPPARARIVELPDLGPGDDIVEFIAARKETGMSRERILAEIDQLIG